METTIMGLYRLEGRGDEPQGLRLRVEGLGFRV